MRPLDWSYLLAASGHLTLAVVSFLRGRRSAVALPLSLLCVALFGMCFCSLVSNLTGPSRFLWGELDAFFSALIPPLILHVAVTFVGARRAHARIVAAGYGLSGALAISSVAGIGTAWEWAWVNSHAWQWAFLVGWLPILLFTAALLLRHLVRSLDPDEKARTRTILAAFAVGGAICTADPIRALGYPVPHLAPIGSLAGTFLVATGVFRFRLLDRDLSVTAALYAGALAVSGIICYLAAFALFGGNIAALVFAMIAVTVGLGTAVYELTSSIATQRERVERLASLGRFSSQMAHDLKNPLATLKGALQFLDEERARGHGLDAHADFVRLMTEQVERLGRVVDDYERIGRVEPIRRSVAVNELVQGVVRLEPFAAQEGVSIRADLADRLPPCELDVDLVRGALENVIRNAFEAMPRGGDVIVRTALDGGNGADRVVISVEDTGEGMDARLAERAFEDFYTTKPRGTGLGLAFVRRVAQAHGGDVSLRSTLGRGTIVSMRLPVAVRG
jgi:signal transduction histidine kinase